MTVERCRVATTQLDVRFGDVEQNLAMHVRLIAEAAAEGCDLVVFPELSVTGHNGSEAITRGAERHDGPIFETIHAQASASGIVVSYGFCERYRGTHYNTSALVGQQGLIGLQRKVHASLDEFLRFRQAYDWSVIDLGFCKVGTAICHDSDFFESWRILALLGAELVLLPHANRTLEAADGSHAFDGRGREASADEILAAQAALLAERPQPPRLHDVQARDNGVYAVFSDQVGFDGQSTHLGGAYVLAPDGSMVARSDCGLGSSMVVAELDPDLLTRVREAPSFPLRKRRPEVYEELTRRS